MLTESELNYFQNKLEKEQEEIQEQLSRSGVKKTENPNNFDPYLPQLGVSDDDNAVEVENYLNGVAVQEMLEHRLEEIVEAIQKIKTNSYGICETCKNQIEMKKLEVNPAADYCINCTKSK